MVSSLFLLTLADISNHLMITPHFLKKGDTIAIAASARKITSDELQPSIDVFESWGLNVITSTNINFQHDQFAGTDEERLNGLQLLLDDDTVKAIIFARGGYGTVRIIDKLDFTAFARSPKWIVGYSDITVLHSHIQQNLGIETLHATMPLNFNTHSEDSALSIESLRKCLFGEAISYAVLNNEANKGGQAQGVVTGGNLSILYSLLGSQSDVDTAGKILFIEDIDEYLYHIDRMMQSLRRAGKLDNLAGLLVGGFTDMRDNEIPFGKTARQIISEAVKEFKYPVIFDFPAGHQPLNQPIILGREASIEITDKVKIVFKEPFPSKGIRRFRNLLKPAAFIIGGFIVLYILYSILLGQL